MSELLFSDLSLKMLTMKTVESETPDKSGPVSSVTWQQAPHHLLLPELENLCHFKAEDPIPALQDPQPLPHWTSGFACLVEDSR